MIRSYLYPLTFLCIIRPILADVSQKIIKVDNCVCVACKCIKTKSTNEYGKFIMFYFIDILLNVFYSFFYHMFYNINFNSLSVFFNINFLIA